MSSPVPASSSLDAIASAFLSCRVNEDLPRAKLLHLHLCALGLEAHPSLGNHLVPLLAVCGALPSAHQAFRKLELANAHSWTSLVQGYARSGDLEHALRLHDRMQRDDEAPPPNRHTFLALLKACISLCRPECGRELHSAAVVEDLLSDRYVAHMLIDLYAKFGFLVDSRDVFEELNEGCRDVVAWSALMSGYAEHGPYDKALECLEMMRSEDIQPNSFTFVAALRACCALGSLREAREIHSEIVVKGFDKDTFIANGLIDLYGSCSLIEEAEVVFDGMVGRDVVSWNALIGGYVNEELDEDALLGFREMQAESINPVSVTFTSLLKACRSKGSIESIHELHSEILKRGYENVEAIGNGLVGTYAKVGLLHESKDMLDRLQMKDSLPWNSLMLGYVEHGEFTQVLNCFQKMHQEGVYPDSVSIISILNTCSHIKDIDRGRRLHAEIIKKGSHQDPFLGNALIDMYAKTGFVTDAEKVFNELECRDIVSWNSLLTGYTEHGCCEEAIECLEHMKMEKVTPNFVTLSCILRACGSVRSVKVGQSIHLELTKKGSEREPLVNSSLIDMYAKFGWMSEAQDIFDKLADHNLVSWTSLFAGYANNGFCDHAFISFQRMQSEGIVPDITSWTIIVSGYVEHGEPTTAINLYAQLQEQGLLPNSSMSASIMKACENMTALDLGKRMDVAVSSHSSKVDDFNFAPALINMHGKCGNMLDCESIFATVASNNPLIWNNLITAYAQLGDYEHVFNLIRKAEGKGIQPDEITFLSILSVCSYAGLLYMGKKCFNSMTWEYGIEKNLKHYTCMIDLLAHSGQLMEALELMNIMPFQPDYAMLCTFLSACRRWHKVSLGEWIVRAIDRLEPRQDGAYLLMYNIYMDAQMQNDAGPLQEIREP